VTGRAPLDPAVAETRVAVRCALGALAPLPTADPGRPAPLVLIALSGGADSLALAAAAAFEAPRQGLRAGAIIVDHGLQAGSERVVARAAAQAERLGLAPVAVRRAEVARDAGDGPEAAARTARYREFEACRLETGAVAVLTAHTRDDQAEQVLLALARGSGVRALAGIPPRREAILRPFLGVSRRSTERACAAQRLEPWRDPHNSDPAFTRVRVRQRILPLLEQELGPGIAANLARTADLAREDADALDSLAEEVVAGLADPPLRTGSVRVPVAVLAEQASAIRHRAIRLVAVRGFASQLSREHTLAVAALVTSWRGQGPVYVPGLRVTRRGADLVFERQLGSPRAS